MQNNKPELGAIWIKQTKSGQQFLSLKDGNRWRTFFVNNYKQQGDKRPDYKEAPPRQQQSPEQNLFGPPPAFNTDEDIMF
jgi:hypothetical protein